jgi:hypothetical protein
MDADDIFMSLEQAIPDAVRSLPPDKQQRFRRR